MNTWRLTITLLILTLSLAACSAPLALTPTAEPALTPDAAYWPTHDWRTSTPEAQGMDSTRLADLVDDIQQNLREYKIHSVVVIRHGYIVAEAYVYPFRPNMKHDLASVTKSFNATLVGIAVDKGYIDDIRRSVVDFFPGRTIRNNDARKQAMTVEHLLTMTSGIDCNDNEVLRSSTSNVINQMMQSQDWTQFLLDRPMADAPGSQWRYTSCNSALLSAIVREKTGMSTLAFAQTYLFKPLGISDVQWMADSTGAAQGGGGLRLTPRDMAKLGYLYLKGGVWDGQQVVPAKWVTASIQSYNRATSDRGYGYQWWTYPTLSAYVASGFGGQQIYVIPNSDLIAVFTASTRGDRPTRLMEEYVLPAVRSSARLPENPGGVARLASLNRQVEQPPAPQPMPPLPAIARAISGKTYVLDRNSLDWQSFVLEFQENEAGIHLSLADNSKRLAIGLDGVERFTQVDHIGPTSGLIALKGEWMDEDSFLLHLEFVDGSERFDFRFDLSEDGVNVFVQGLTQGEYELIRGKLES